MSALPQRPDISKLFESINDCNLIIATLLEKMNTMLEDRPTASSSSFDAEVQKIRNNLDKVYKYRATVEEKISNLRDSLNEEKIPGSHKETESSVPMSLTF